MTMCLTSRRSQPPLALAVPLSRFTSRVGGGSAFYVRPLRAHEELEASFIYIGLGDFVAYCMACGVGRCEGHVSRLGRARWRSFSPIYLWSFDFCMEHLDFMAFVRAAQKALLVVSSWCLSCFVFGCRSRLFYGRGC